MISTEHKEPKKMNTGKDFVISYPLKIYINC